MPRDYIQRPPCGGAIGAECQDWTGTDVGVHDPWARHIPSPPGNAFTQIIIHRSERLVSRCSVFDGGRSGVFDVVLGTSSGVL